MRDPNPSTSGADTELTALDPESLPAGAKAAQEAAVDAAPGQSSRQAGSTDAEKLAESPDAASSGVLDSGLPS